MKNISFVKDIRELPFQQKGAKKVQKGILMKTSHGLEGKLLSPTHEGINLEVYLLVLESHID